MRDGLPARRVAMVGAVLLLAGGAWAGWLMSRQAPEAPAVQTGPYRPELVLLPPGEFVMGSPEGEEGRESDEKQHTVKLTRGFFLGKTEVTQGQWTALMGRNPAYFQGERTGGPDFPVEQVSWFDAVVYLNRLSEAEGLTPCYRLADCKGEPGTGCTDAQGGCTGDYTCDRVDFVGLDCPGYRLPTEAEWEYAARASTTGAIYHGEWKVLGERNAPVLDPLAWYGGNSGTQQGYDCSDWPDKQYPDLKQCGSQPVGRKRANAWGLHDMLGNVWEWTHDAHTDALSDATDPLQAGDSAAARRVLRGCGWFDYARLYRAAYRILFEPATRIYDLGLRPARSSLAP